MIKHTKNIRLWVNRIAIFSLSLGLLSMAVIFYSLSRQKNSTTPSCEAWLSQTISPLSYKAKVLKVNKKADSDCNFELELSSETPNYLKVCECPEEGNFISRLEQGDSIFKILGEGKLYLKKANHVFQAFPYPCCE